jgi:hypothetical protein
VLALPARHEPSPRCGDATVPPVLPEGGAVEIERTVTRDGLVSIAGATHLVGFAWAWP